MLKQLLTEDIYPRDGNPILTEQTQEGGFLYLKGLFLEGEVQNHNGRIYPKDQIVAAVNSMMERIKRKGPIFGELDHPEGLNINFDRISHAITEIHVEGNNAFGTMKVMNGGLGLILKAACEIGHPGVRRRGSGNVGSNGMVREFDIVTVDAVINPRAPNAFPKASLGESLMNSRYGREALRLTQWAQSSKEAQSYLYKNVEKFLTELSKGTVR